jgi:hypothetical protein
VNRPLSIRPANNFMAPVWVMIIVVLVRILITVNTILAMRELQRHGSPFNKFALFSGLALIGIAITETAVYWRIRRKKYNRTSARLHLLCMLVATVVLPVLFLSLSRLAEYFINRARFITLIRTVGKLQFYVFWICFIAATIFFASVVISAFSPADESIEDRIDAIGKD